MNLQKGLDFIDKVADQAITATQIATATITGTQIANATVTGTNIANATITASNISNATITGTEIAAATITGSNIASSTITASNIQSATITGTQIASATITGSNIAASTITGSNIQNATITGSNVASTTITAANIADASILGTKIANVTITATQIADLTITGGKIANATITNAKIADLSADKITAGTVTLSDWLTVTYGNKTVKLNGASGILVIDTAYGYASHLEYGYLYCYKTSDSSALAYMNPGAFMVKNTGIAAFTCSSSQAAFTLACTSGAFAVAANSTGAVYMSVNSTVVLSGTQWVGTAIGVAYGGTGATDIATARTNLSVYSKSEIDAVVNAIYANLSSVQSSLQTQINNKAAKGTYTDSGGDTLTLS